MKKSLFMFIVALTLVWTGASLAADQPKSGDLKEVALVQAKGVKGEAKGKIVLNTANGVDVSIQISGLDPKGLYTAFFVNEQSQMFEGIGPAPHVLKVNEKGEADFKGTIKKDVYKRFVAAGIYLNPGGKPMANPVGVKAALGDLVAKDKPKLILLGKLR
ncbi:MAG: hypothetical protein NT047_01630 [Deltaproteobacteria bacterium]|nr:hypothetical protein [Deltaproteobacteria bacterium]